jgi:hypothetical protein
VCVVCVCGVWVCGESVWVMCVGGERGIFVFENGGGARGMDKILC